MQDRDPQLVRAWTRLPSGAHLNLLDPNAGAWTDDDLAVRLSRTPRWSGETIWPHSLSVAQHSLLVLAISMAESGGDLSVDRQLIELLHDAEEGLLGFDCSSPLKPVLGAPFADTCARLLAAVWARYDLHSWTPIAHQAHKRADTTAAACEAVYCAGWSRDEVRDVLGIRAPILEIDPLVAIYDCAPWAPWPAEVAAQRFGAELRRLLGIRQAVRALKGEVCFCDV